MFKPVKVLITQAQIDAVSFVVTLLRVEINGSLMTREDEAKARRRLADLDDITKSWGHAQTAARLKAVRRRAASQRCETASSTPGSARRAPLPAATVAGLSITK
ncbi:hypothetical protein [Hydrocarboniphaga effusa]|uniref:hypothetical protein n=1 Tax=Hydrocarboniphaga effusa TaxID=243629 RepID=UPI003BAA70AC